MLPDSGHGLRCVLVGITSQENVVLKLLLRFVHNYTHSMAVRSANENDALCTYPVSAQRPIFNQIEKIVTRRSRPLQ